LVDESASAVGEGSRALSLGVATCKSWPRRDYALLIVLCSSIPVPTVLISARTPGNLTRFASVSGCAVTLFVWLWRRNEIHRLAGRLRLRPAKKTLVFGGLGAAPVETVWGIGY